MVLGNLSKQALFALKSTNAGPVNHGGINVGNYTFMDGTFNVTDIYMTKKVVEELKIELQSGGVRDGMGFDGFYHRC